MRLFPIAAALTLAACGTAQSTQYFVLPDSRYIRPATQGGETAIEVRLAEPLKRGGLVYQTDPYRLNTAQNHVWADTLDDMLEAALSNAFNRLDSTRTFVPASRSGSTEKWTVYIDAFQGSYTGKTLISGYAVLPDGTNRPFHIETEQQGDGYAAMTAALEQGLKQAAQQMVE
ncbi:PqiC family protein [Neisseria polysaccharea]|uniref:PqiC family protein n=1 Tax=Neisseria polysaccharea TaxID=489 RepID=UPI0027DFF4A2|nr:membrane integrity-associated transporter subunit PqiC [Neisseria polysaccharea]